MNSHESEHARSSDRRQAEQRWDEALRLLRDAPGATDRAEPAEPDRGQAAGSDQAEREDAGARQVEREEAGTLELEREQLRPRRVTREGAVDVHTDVVTEMRTIQVPVQRERVKVERVSPDEQSSTATGDPRASAPAAAEGPVTLPVREEEIVVQKRPVVAEEVTIDTRARQDVEHVSETVRREQARIEAQGDAAVHEEHQATEPD